MQKMKRAFLILVLVLFTVTMFLRWNQGRRQAGPASQMTGTGSVPESETSGNESMAGNGSAGAALTEDAQVSRGSEPEETEKGRAPERSATAGAAVEAASDSGAGTAASAAGGTASGRSAYTERTYALATDLAYARSNGGDREQIEGLLDELQNEDAALGKLWEQVMGTWFSVTEMPADLSGRLPEGLPQDESLCIVVLGFQLTSDGSMAPELTARCEVALAAAEQYPRARIAVTGGGTAGRNRDATEADVMAEWMIAHGVDEGRIIRENTSLTTIENAKRTCAILAEEYPEIREIAMVTSSYHMPLGVLLFSAAAFQREYETGVLPYTVSAVAACCLDGGEQYLNLRYQGRELWSLLDPKY